MEKYIPCAAKARRRKQKMRKGVNVFMCRNMLSEGIQEKFGNNISLIIFTEEIICYI